jgi:hypothetical protein
MDKLSEPEFESDRNWPRMKLGVEDYIAKKEKNQPIFFGLLSLLSIGRYWREITFYKKDYPLFVAAIIPTFLFTSYQISKYLVHDPYAYAALDNNEEERKYIENYRSLWREAKKKNIEIPNHLLKI